MKFLSRSLLILLLLYGLVFALGAVLLSRIEAPLWVALLFPIVFVGFQYLIGPWIIEQLLDIHWLDEGAEVPAQNIQFIQKLCAERRMQVPRIGVIESGTPNAFSFGRIRRDSRVVVTSGLFDVLTPEEANAVLAHELGHVEHRDFVVMTIASIAPLLLYQIYVYSEKISSTKAIAYTAYACYLVSQFIVLLLNRTREYFADHYAGEVTKSPQVLASALIKIAYGMVRADGEIQRSLTNDEGDQKKGAARQRRLAGAIGVMGISNLRSGAALALSGADSASASAVMRWDLVNPWSRLYELNSTHPLTALRVRALNLQSGEMHQSVQYPLPQRTTIRWGMFPIEVVLWAGPWLCAAIFFTSMWWPELFSYFGLDLSHNVSGTLLLVGGATWIVRTWYRYHGHFEPARIGSLIENVDVSQMRPLAVRLKGEILGRGVPGAFWSPDLVVRDSTGILFVLYRQTIPLARLFFAMSEAESYIGKVVVLEGWFRRGLTPYVEMATLTSEDGMTHRAYSRWIQYALSAGAIVVGCWLLWG
jgi:heat shock protein HtpX